MTILYKNLLLFGLFISIETSAQTSGRFTVDISSNDWRLWLDTAARWQEDKLFAPPVDVTSVPVNLPTDGWGILKNEGIPVHLPATVEEYFWGHNGNSFGVSGNYLAYLGLPPISTCHPIKRQTDRIGF